MNLIHFKEILSEIISLVKNAGVEYDDHTTKHISVKPNRHTLAIFTPKHSTGVNASYSDFTVYGGLIGVNTRPKGNSPSRICAVVETRQPYLWLAKFTKHIGASIMTAILTGILAKLSHFTPLESLVIGFILGLPMACLVIGFLSVMGV